MENKLAKVFSAELEGISATLVEVEVDLNVGLHAFTIVGLADKAIAEAKERVNSALKNSGVKPPNRENRRITVNLAPADVRKTGAQYDLAIAIGYLLASGQMAAFEVKDRLFLGELALDGRLRSINGALNIAELARARGFEYIFLPRANANEAAIISGIKIIPIENLPELINVLEGRSPLFPHIFREEDYAERNAPDLSEIKGQEHAKRALIIAAAGFHNLLFRGPPGAGKSLLAEAMLGILPALTLKERIEVTKIWSAAGQSLQGLVKHRPYRAPHQNASAPALIGGGAEPKPGEISLAHRGVLFLDELPEFQRNVLESLRGPLENGAINVSRARGTLRFPARFTFLAAMNPCPCGFFGDTEKECTCTAREVLRYQKKISGPILDRIDLQVEVPRVELHALRSGNSDGHESEEARARINSAREIQARRFANKPDGLRVNSAMSAREAEHFARLDGAGEKFLTSLAAKYLSPRGYYRLLKTARTIADLENKEIVSAPELAEAFSYRLHEE